jgi:hypothetical protein
LLAKRGGVRFASGAVQIHIGIEHDFHPARKAHPALRCCEYDAVLAQLNSSGVEVREAGDIQEYAARTFAIRFEIASNSSRPNHRTTARTR